MKMWKKDFFITLLLVLLTLFGCKTISEKTYNTPAEAMAAFNEKHNPDSSSENPANAQVIEKTVIEYRKKEIEVPIQEFIIDNVGSETVVKSLGAKSALIKKNNDVSTVGLSEGNFQHAEILYNFKNGIIYPVHTAIKKATVIQLQEGEKIVSYLCGDAMNWFIENEVIGNTANIYVMPKLTGLATNFIVNTDRRRYLINLLQNCNYMPVVKWSYGINLDIQPENAPIIPIANAIGSATGNITDIKPGEPTPSYIRQGDLVLLDRLGTLNFDYDVIYKSHRNFKPKWFPGRIFDDGFRTYINIPGLDQTPIRPVIFATDRRGKNLRLVTYHVSGKYYIVDSIEQQLLLTTEIDNKYENIFIRKK